MSLMSIAVTLFPPLHALSCLAIFALGVHRGDLCLLFLSVFDLYLVPPILYRIHNLIWPMKPGYTDITEKKYVPWYGSHQLQLLFVTCPAIEGLLRLVPGLYSCWLRLWGAEIGKGVYWTPQVEIIDRPLMIVGSKVVIGHLVKFCAHYITPYKGKLSLYVAPIEVGENAFVGAESRLSAGVKITPGAVLKYHSICRPNQTYGDTDQS